MIAERMNRRGMYYTNVVFWTLQFILPFYCIIDFLFLKKWEAFLTVRLIVLVLSYLSYLAMQRKKLRYDQCLHMAIGLFLICNSVIACIVPNEAKITYFLLLSVCILLINATVFWRPLFSLLHVLLSIIVIVYVYLAENLISSINVLVRDGAGMYLVVSIFSCLVAANRFPLIRRNIERKLLLERSNRLLIEQNEQINEQRLAIEEVNRALQESNTFKSDTLRIIIHDIRSCTSSVTMILDSLEDEIKYLSDDVKTGIAHIEAANNKLTHFSQTLVTATRQGQTGKIDFSVTEFDLNEEARSALQNLTPNIMINNIDLLTQFSEQPLIVKMDKIFVNQALFKLFSNVFRFARNGSLIQIRSFMKGGTTAVIEVQDKSLPPIGQDRLAQMFNTLQQGEAVPDKQGFGFSVSKRLVENMGGRLFYASNDEEGNYFRIEFEIFKSY